MTKARRKDNRILLQTQERIQITEQLHLEREERQTPV
jgi:hypothetical protein